MKKIRLKQSAKFWLFISPWLAAFAFFTLTPIVLSFVMSFTGVKITNMFTRAWKFVGFLNYKDTFTDVQFLRSIGNTFLYSFGKVALSMVLSLMFALMLYKDFAGKKVYRVLLYLPAVIPAVSSALLWSLIVYQDRGLLVTLIQMLGGPKIDFGRPQYAMLSVLFINCLGMIGPWMVVLVAALQSVPQDIIEASLLDGCGYFRRLWKMVIPMISPSIFFLGVTGFINALQSYAEIELLIKSNYYTYTMTMSIMDNAFGGLGMGYASAQAWIVFVIISVFTALFFKFFYKRVYYMGES